METIFLNFCLGIFVGLIIALLAMLFLAALGKDLEEINTYGLIITNMLFWGALIGGMAAIDMGITLAG